MKIKIILFLLVSFYYLPFNFGQQELFIARNIRTAYENGTRSLDGKLGAEYRQNSAEYKINVEIDPLTYQMNGKEEIKYYNNSPDSLNRVVIRLYPNLFKKGSARDYSINPEAITDGVKITEIKISDRSVNLENKSIYREVSTVATLSLPEAVHPGSSIEFSIEWSLQLSPKATLRMGVYDSTTVFWGYWYPQIAVYDDLDGWDTYNYGGQEEFYNDFSDFDVCITAPNNFGVWATGELQNPVETLSDHVYKKFLSAMKSDTVVRIITAEDLTENSNYNSENLLNTWRFTARKVTDFAFAISDHYLWDGLNAIVDSVNYRSVFIQAVYPADSPDFYEVANASRDLIKYFSFEMPGIAYPFPSIVAFNNGSIGGGGMEFPMIINNGSSELWENTVALAAHEIAHQYFPFFVGTNEKKYAFMDEGWAVMLPFTYMERMVGINTRLISNVGNYEYRAGTEDDIPMIATSLSQHYVSYRNSAYDKSSIAYECLRDFLGEEIFLKALQEFIIRWNGKHPTPYDFFFTFNNVSGQDLTWFWKPWFFEYGFPDLAIERVVVQDSSAKIEIRKIGNIPTPVRLKIIYEDSTSADYYFKADVWKDNSDYFSVEISLSGILKEITLGDLKIPDSNRENNYYIVH